LAWQFDGELSQKYYLFGEHRFYLSQFAPSIEEGRTASQITHEKFGYFLSMSQRAFSAYIFPNSAVGIFSPKTEGTKTSAAVVAVFGSWIRDP
jgi:hypothetical protein